MGATTLNEVQFAAAKAAARAYGVPVAGKGLVVAFDATAKTLALEADSFYVLCATAAVFLGAADTTQAANKSIYLPANTLMGIQTQAAFTLYATQVTGAGSLYAGKTVDAG